ncbi:MAG: translation initiation factor IF-2 subunit beta [Nanoarchaeota archaeon]|nr:translation initiation factor IF-2 subunit beta [Nanoarchaeota archaeon]MBU1322406.1 translation initiation factor IF-2 subunit beta [Nanoarchaeota archaeon]MBU1598218.1 translation initiation factor IF-2 subunit beta [Nanoarchaeota archaeon]MBU2441074.1 translation initiation factor IF-2 subunit beta [Nanoarchaeota archaeon]
MTDYESLLDRGKKELPETSKSSERFNIPKVRGHIQGNKTIISNFLQIAQHLGRKPEHMLKFVLKELASPGDIKKQFVLLGTKIPASRINEKIQKYADTFVVCRECGKPDTKMTKEGNVYFIKCQACGARYSVFSKV